MATAAQITANRANALPSAGPKSPEGKLASSQNAARHGFTSMKITIATADLAEFEEFKQELLAEVHPEGAIEESLFERFLLTNRNRRRITRYKTELLDERTRSPDATQVYLKLASRHGAGVAPDLASEIPGCPVIRPALSKLNVPPPPTGPVLPAAP